MVDSVSTLFDVTRSEFRTSDIELGKTEVHRDPIEQEKSGSLCAFPLTNVPYPRHLQLQKKRLLTDRSIPRTIRGPLIAGGPNRSQKEASND